MQGPPSKHLEKDDRLSIFKTQATFDKEILTWVQESLKLDSIGRCVRVMFN